MREFPRIETERLVLRLAELKDLSAILSYYRTNEGHLSPFEPKKTENFYTETYWENRIKKSMEGFHADQLVHFFLFDSAQEDEVVGTLEFSQIARGPFQACFLGYGIGKKYEGQGFMLEAAKAAIDYAFMDLNLHRIMANHLPENERSANLLKRLGFVREGLAKDYLRINGLWRDHVLNSLTNSHWREGS